jgi:hypothetical protein
LIASDGYALIAVRFSRSIFACDYRTHGVNYVFETHRQIIKSIEAVGSKSCKHDFARKPDIFFYGIEAESHDSVLVFMPCMSHLPPFKAIGLAFRLKREVKYDLSLEDFGFHAYFGHSAFFMLARYLGITRPLFRAPSPISDRNRAI